MGYYRPKWKGAVEGYVVNTSQKTWRFHRTHEHEDLVQEAYLVFLKCQRAYPVLDTPQHFMALFKTAWTRRMHELANKNTRINKIAVAADVNENEMQAAEGAEVGAQDNDGQLLTMIRQAPREIALVLQLFLNAPTELIELAEASWNNSRRGLEKSNANAMVKRLLGDSVSDKPVDKVIDYFLMK